MPTLFFSLTSTLEISFCAIHTFKTPILVTPLFPYPSSAIMFVIRRAAFRALATSSSQSSSIAQRSSRSLSSITSLRLAPSSSISSSRSSLFLQSQRSYATESETPEKVKDAADTAVREAEEALESAQEKASETLESAKESAAGAAASVAPSVTRRRGFAGMEEPQPSNTIYIGNLYFEMSEDTIKRECERYGQVEDVKIITDNRGLSKGYGYVRFSNETEAAEARDQMHGQILEGRRLAVNWAISNTRNPGKRIRSPPSSTVFIGNMSWEMTDKDLNELFRDLKNVTNVRIAIDRHTGQPRGFAHADFTDVESATAAKDALEGREVYGRRLMTDFGDSRADRQKEHSAITRREAQPQD